MYALDMARGLRDLHNIDGDGVVSATHGDLKEDHYLLKKDGRLVLGDFNKGEIHVLLSLSSLLISLPISILFPTQVNSYPNHPPPETHAPTAPHPHRTTTSLSLS